MEIFLKKTHTTNKFYQKKQQKENFLKITKNFDSKNRLSRRILGLANSSISRREMLNLDLEKINNFALNRKLEKKNNIYKKKKFLTKENSLYELKKELQNRVDFSILKILVNLENKNKFIKLKNLFDFLGIERNDILNRFLSVEELTRIFSCDLGNVVKISNGEFNRECLDRFFTRRTKDLMKAIAILYFS